MRIRFAFFERPMTRPRRTALLLAASMGLVVGVAAVLVFTVPSFKLAAKERWRRWSAPELPKKRSERIAADGRISYNDPFPYCASHPERGPVLHFDFECPQSTWFASTDSAFSGRGAMVSPWNKAAIIRRASDVTERPISISAGFMMKCAEMTPDVRIVIRIDHADGTLLDWNEKRLIGDEHLADHWERFNFEWTLRDLSIGPDDNVAVFVIGPGDGALWIDEMDIVFRNATVLKPSRPHA